MSIEPVAWKRCNTCKGDLAFGQPYFACSVSTCNRGDNAFAFCSVECWDAHVPVLRHREAWAVEERAPDAPPEPSPEPEVRAPQRTVVPPAGGAAPGPARASGALPRDVLVVVSKLKAYVRAASGMNTSDGVTEVLSDRLRALCDDAIERARTAGRKTVLDRDFR